MFARERACVMRFLLPKNSSLLWLLALFWYGRTRASLFLILSDRVNVSAKASTTQRMWHAVQGTEDAMLCGQQPITIAGVDRRLQTDRVFMKVKVDMLPHPAHNSSSQTVITEVCFGTAHKHGKAAAADAEADWNAVVCLSTVGVEVLSSRHMHMRWHAHIDRSNRSIAAGCATKWILFFFFGFDVLCAAALKKKHRVFYSKRCSTDWTPLLRQMNQTNLDPHSTKITSIRRHVRTHTHAPRRICHNYCNPNNTQSPMN